MDKLELVRALKLANDLWAIEGANPYSVRAHDVAADAILESPLSVSDILRLPPSSIRGVGRETLAMITALNTGGMPALLRRLNITIPLESAELLKLPGIGPKTAHILIHQHGIYSAEKLSRALHDNQLDSVPGLGAKRISRLRRDVRVFLEREHSLPIAVAWPAALEAKRIIHLIPAVERVCITGALRRLAVMVPRIELVVSAEDADPLLEFAAQHQPHANPDQTHANPVSPDYSYAHLPSPTHSHSNPASPDHSHDAQSSIVVDLSLPIYGDPLPVRLHITTSHAYACTVMRTTGDETHQGVIEGLLQQRDIEWTKDELRDTRAVPIRVGDEADIYKLIGLPFFPPEVREGQGLLVRPERLVQTTDIRGDLHVHSKWSDGSLSIAEIAHFAEELGYEYVAITDHSRSLTIAGGLTAEELLAQHREIEMVQPQTRVHLLHGIEVDILSDGSLDLPNDILMQLDIVIASVHSVMHQSESEMTHRLLRAISNPAVHVIGHLTGRILGRRSGYTLDVPRVLDAAIAHGVMFELNANPNRLDVSDELLRAAKTSGMLIPVNTDTHHRAEFRNMEYGIRMAQRGWLYKENVLNALSYEQLVKKLDEKRSGK